MKEIWKDIKGYEHKYQISNFGNVKIKENKFMKMNMGEIREHIQKEKIMKPTNNGKNYLKIGLYKDNKHKNKYIHRLVAEHFLDNKYNLPQVNHKDGNKHNNHINNIEWVSAKENMHHSKNKLKNIPGFNQRKPVLQIDLTTNKVIKEYCSASEAQRQTNISHISSVCRNERNHAGGFKWKYK